MTEVHTVRKEYEVDFVVNSASERCYIRSAWKIPDDSKMRQEKNALLNIPDSFRKIIITNDYLKPKTDDDGIIRMGIINFLTGDSII